MSPTLFSKEGATPNDVPVESHLQLGAALARLLAVISLVVAGRYPETVDCHSDRKACELIRLNF